MHDAGDTTMALLGYHIDVVGSVGMMQFAGKMMQNDAATLWCMMQVDVVEIMMHDAGEWCSHNTMMHDADEWCSPNERVASQFHGMMHDASQWCSHT